MLPILLRFGFLAPTRLSPADGKIGAGPQRRCRNVRADGRKFSGQSKRRPLASGAGSGARVPARSEVGKVRGTSSGSAPSAGAHSRADGAALGKTRQSRGGYGTPHAFQTKIRIAPQSTPAPVA